MSEADYFEQFSGVEPPMKVYEGMIAVWDDTPETRAKVQADFERYQREHPDQDLALELIDRGMWTPFGRYQWHIVRIIHDLP